MHGEYSVDVCLIAWCGSQQMRKLFGAVASSAILGWAPLFWREAALVRFAWLSRIFSPNTGNLVSHIGNRVHTSNSVDITFRIFGPLFLVRLRFLLDSL